MTYKVQANHLAGKIVSWQSVHQGGPDDGNHTGENGHQGAAI